MMVSEEVGEIWDEQNGEPTVPEAQGSAEQTCPTAANVTIPTPCRPATTSSAWCHRMQDDD